MFIPLPPTVYGHAIHKAADMVADAEAAHFGAHGIEGAMTDSMLLRHRREGCKDLAGGPFVTRQRWREGGAGESCYVGTTQS